MMKKTTFTAVLLILGCFLNFKAQSQIAQKAWKSDTLFKSSFSEKKRFGEADFLIETASVPLPEVGSNWQALVINGATDFLIDRAKQEVQAAFILDLKKVFELDSLKSCTANEWRMAQARDTLFNTAFPNLKKTVGLVAVSYSKNYLSMLHAAIMEDFKNLPAALFTEGANKLLRKEGLSNDLKLTTSMMNAVQGIMKGENPALCLMKIETEKSDSSISTMVDLVRKLAQESYEVSSLAASYKGLTLKMLMSSIQFRDTFFDMLKGSLDSQYSKIICKGNWKLTAIEILNGIEKLSGFPAQINEAETDSARRVLYGSFLSSLATTLRVAGDLVSDKEGEKIWQKAMDYLDHAVNMYQSILVKDYHKVLVQLTSLMDEVYLEQKTFKVLTFAANLAEVKSREDVELALQAFAQPVGSFRTKRLEEKPRGYFMLNAYLGYSYGRECLIPSNGLPEKKMGSFHGLSLPVGLEFGASTGKKVISSVGLFLSPIDLGTMASYRIGQNSWDSLKVNNRDEISFRNIFSPSAMLTFGISRNKPITLAIGYQYAPEQRTLVNSTLNTNSDIAVHRVFASLAFDLSLFRF